MGWSQCGPVPQGHSSVKGDRTGGCGLESVAQCYRDIHQCSGTGLEGVQGGTGLEGVGWSQCGPVLQGQDWRVWAGVSGPVPQGHSSVKGDRTGGCGLESVA